MHKFKEDDKVRISRFENNMKKESLIEHRDRDHVYCIESLQPLRETMRYSFYDPDIPISPDGFKAASFYVYDESYFIPAKPTNKERIEARRRQCTDSK